jgi:hypothetical protein
MILPSPSLAAADYLETDRDTQNCQRRQQTTETIGFSVERLLPSQSVAHNNS